MRLDRCFFSGRWKLGCASADKVPFHLYPTTFLTSSCTRTGTRTSVSTSDASNPLLFSSSMRSFPLTQRLWNTRPIPSRPASHSRRTGWGGVRVIHDWVPYPEPPFRAVTPIEAACIFAQYSYLGSVKAHLNWPSWGHSSIQVYQRPTMRQVVFSPFHHGGYNHHAAFCRYTVGFEGASTRSVTISVPPPPPAPPPPSSTPPDTLPPSAAPPVATKGKPRNKRPPNEKRTEKKK